MFGDTHPTTHANPTYQVHNSTFYCVANMPGAVPNTSTYALTNATLPYVMALADKLPCLPRVNYASTTESGPSTTAGICAFGTSHSSFVVFLIFTPFRCPRDTGADKRTW